MSAVPALSELRASGIELWADGGRVHYRAPADVLTPDLLSTLKANKDEILRSITLEGACGEACKGLSGYITAAGLLAKLAPEDIAELEANPDPLPFLRSFAIACVWTAFRQDGIAPPGWDKSATCDRCGPVLLWAPLHVAGCPWCWNRIHGLKIPRPPITQNSERSSDFA